MPSSGEVFRLITETRKSNVDNLNNVRREASRNFNDRKGECMKYKIYELATYSHNKNIGDLYLGVNEFKSNLLKDKNGHLLADSNNILNRWKNSFLSY
jgi:hypothetical protein